MSTKYITKSNKYKISYKLFNMDVVILAAGYGNRMGDLTKNYPKQMLPVAGKPVLEWNILFIKENLNLRDIIIVTGYKEEIIKDYFKDGKDFGVNISYVTQNLDEKPVD